MRQTIFVDPLKKIHNFGRIIKACAATFIFDVIVQIIFVAVVIETNHSQDVERTLQQIQYLWAYLIGALLSCYCFATINIKNERIHNSIKIKRTLMMICRQAKNDAAQSLIMFVENLATGEVEGSCTKILDNVSRQLDHIFATKTQMQTDMCQRLLDNVTDCIAISRKANSWLLFSIVHFIIFIYICILLPSQLIVHMGWFSIVLGSVMLFIFTFITGGLKVQIMSDKLNKIHSTYEMDDLNFFSTQNQANYYMEEKIH